MQNNMQIEMEIKEESLLEKKVTFADFRKFGNDEDRDEVFFVGNERKFISNGAWMLSTEHLPTKHVKEITNKKNFPIKNINPDGIDEMIKKIRSLYKPLIFKSVTKTNPNGVHDMVILFPEDEEKETVSIFLNYYVYLKNNYKGLILKGYRSNDPVMIFNFDNFVGYVMPYVPF